MTAGLFVAAAHIILKLAALTGASLTRTAATRSANDLSTTARPEPSSGWINQHFQSHEAHWRGSCNRRAPLLVWRRGAFTPLAIGAPRRAQRRCRCPSKIPIEMPLAARPTWNNN